MSEEEIKERKRQYNRAYYQKNRMDLIEKQKKYNQLPHVKEKHKQNLLNFYARKLAKIHELEG